MKKPARLPRKIRSANAIECANVSASLARAAILMAEVAEREIERNPASAAAILRNAISLVTNAAGGVVWAATEIG